MKTVTPAICPASLRSDQPSADEMAPPQTEHEPSPASKGAEGCLVGDRQPSATPRQTSPEREVNYQHSRNVPEVLKQLGLSLLVSTYQAGKVVAVGAAEQGVQLSFHNFDRAMGLALEGDRLAVGTTRQIWMLRKSVEPVPGLGPDGSYDSSFLVRRAWFTNNIQSHEMAWSGDDLWVVNTRFSCLCVPDDTGDTF